MYKLSHQETLHQPEARLPWKQLSLAVNGSN